MKTILLLVMVFGLMWNDLNAEGIKPIRQEIQTLQKRGIYFEEFQIFKPTLNSEKASRIPAVLKEGSILQIDRNDLTLLYKKRPETISINIPYQSGQLKLTMYRTEIMTRDFILKTEQGEISDYEQGIFYRGILEGKEESLVAFSFFKDEVVGLISTPSLKNIVVTRYNKSKNPSDYILYSDKDLLKTMPFTCQSRMPEPEVSQKKLTEHQTEIMTTTDKCVRMYYEINFDIYQKSDSSVSKAMNWTSALHHGAATIYHNEGIHLAISEILVWTTPTPFSHVLDFREYRRHFNGDVANFILASSPILGGLALGPGSICSDYLTDSYKMGPYEHTVVQYDYDSLPAYSRSLYSFAHETGHVLGCHHSHNCVWNGNNTQIDDCGNFGPSEFDEYFMACFDSLHPVWPATGEASIMSYCTEISLVYGFGPQPAERMRALMESSGCLGTDCIHSCVSSMDSIQVTDIGTHTANVKVFDSDSSNHSWEYRVLTNWNPGPYLIGNTNPFVIQGLNPAFDEYMIEVRTHCPLPFTANYWIRSPIFHTVFSYCGQIFTDNGGDGDNYNPIPAVTIIRPLDSLHKVAMHFNYFQTNFGDTLKIFNGPSVQDSLIGWYEGYGTDIPDLLSSHSSGALTVDFKPKPGSQSAMGWYANVTCVLPTDVRGKFDGEEPFRLHPNPGTGYTILEIPASWIGFQYEVVDVFGKSVLKGIPTQTINKIDIGHFSSGVYTFKVKNGSSPQRLIIRQN